MEKLVALFWNNWPRKLTALATATLIWILTNHSIIETKTIANVPVKIVKLPVDKTIAGLLPNGILSRRISLTLSGSKEVIHKIEPGDLEVVLDASTATQDEWLVRITKQNLHSLNPDLDLAHHITQVSHPDLIIKHSRLMTAGIPVTFMPHTGEAPEGYEYLDFWPQQLTQTLSGPEEDIQRLKLTGLDLSFDLSRITVKDLQEGKNAKKSVYEDEIRFLVPDSWKQLYIPCLNTSPIPLNDPEASQLRIYFLKQQLVPIEYKLPLGIFVPLHKGTVVPSEKWQIAPNQYVQIENGVPIFQIPLYLKNVSTFFVQIIRDYLELTLVPQTNEEGDSFTWSLQVINPNWLEEQYVAKLKIALAKGENGQKTIPAEREKLIRQRFREFLHRLTPYLRAERPLSLQFRVEEGKILVSSI